MLEYLSHIKTWNPNWNVSMLRHARQRALGTLKADSSRIAVYK